MFSAHSESMQSIIQDCFKELHIVLQDFFVLGCLLGKLATIKDLWSYNWSNSLNIHS